MDRTDPSHTGEHLDSDSDSDYEPSEGEEEEAAATAEEASQEVPSEEVKASESARLNELWADFLADVEQPPRLPDDAKSSSVAVASVSGAVKVKPKQQSVSKPVLIAKPPTLPDTSISAADSSTSSATPAATGDDAPSDQSKATKRAPPSGLSSALASLSKKPKLSTLNKSKDDWERFKDEKGLSDELRTHNLGKDGYLERQDFLQRSDERQFEMERSIRAANRKPNANPL